MEHEHKTRHQIGIEQVCDAIGGCAAGCNAFVAALGVITETFESKVHPPMVVEAFHKYKEKKFKNFDSAFSALFDSHNYAVEDFLKEAKQCWPGIYFRVRHMPNSNKKLLAFAKLIRREYADVHYSFKFGILPDCWTVTDQDPDFKICVYWWEIRSTNKVSARKIVEIANISDEAGYFAIQIKELLLDENVVVVHPAETAFFMKPSPEKKFWQEYAPYLSHEPSPINLRHLSGLN